MKIVHTFASYNTIWKERLYIQLLSALYAKKHYGNIHLYTTAQEAEQVEEIGIPYDSIDTSLFTESDRDCYSIPKLKTYSTIKEPYLHIDCDSVFYEKLDLDRLTQKKSPVIYSHPDMKHHSKLGDVKFELGDHIPLLLNNRDEAITNHDYYWIHHVYLKLYLELFHTHSRDVKKYFDFKSIPNMSLVLVNDPESFSKASDMAIQHYKEYKDIIDGNEMGPCYIEQLMVHEYLLTISEDYRRRVAKKDIFFFKNVPLSITLKVQKKTKPNISETEFPFKFRVNDWCNCCKRNKGLKKHKMLTPESISEYFGFKFNGYTHFSFLQWNQIWQTIVINEIVTEFGVDYMIRAHKYFFDLYPKLNLPVYSEGELMYEKLTGNKIFTK